MTNPTWSHHLLVWLLYIGYCTVPVYCGDECALMCMLRPDMSIRKEGRLTPERLPLQLPCTHVIYGRATINSRHEIVEGMDGDLPSLTQAGNYHKLNKMRLQNPDMQLLLGVEAKDEDRMQFLSNPFTRKTFINSLHVHLREYGFDGVFLDIAPTQAKWQYVQLLKDMRKAFLNDAALTKRDTLLIVVAISSYQLEACESLMAALVKQSDFIYLVTEDVIPDDKKTAYVDPLYPARKTPEAKTISYAARYAVKIGIPKEKLIIGYSLWATTYTLLDTRYDQAGSDAKGFGKPGPYTNKDGRLAYFEVCERRDVHLERTPLHDDQTLGSSLVTKKDQWISYNGATDIFARKVSWVGTAGYGGVGLDSLDADDFIGICQKGEVYPLLKATESALTCYHAKPRPKNETLNAGPSPLSDTPAISPCMRYCYYRPAQDVSEFKFDSIDSQWCTHVVIGPALFQPDGTVSVAPAVSLGRRLFDDWTPSGPKPRLLLAIGADQTADEWRALLGNAKTRYRFAEEMVKVLRDINAVGVDLMWMKGLDSKQTGLIKLIQELRHVVDADDQKRILVLSVLPAAIINDYYDMETIRHDVDVFHVLGHKFHSAESKKSGHHASLFASYKLEDERMSLEAMTSKIMSKGVRAEQIVIGVTAEAMVQTLHRDDASATPRVGLLTTGPGRPSSKTKQEGSAAYFEVWNAMNKPGARYEWLKEIGVPVGVSDDQYFAYDNAESVALKARWASLKGFGGVSLWALEYDDPWGLCPGGFRFPLLQTMANNHICSRCLTSQQQNKDKCDDSWSVRCEFNLSPSEKSQYLSPESLPWKNCTHMVIRDIKLNAQGEVVVPNRGDKTSDYERARLVQQTSKTKLIASVTCDMEREIFEVTVKRSELRNKMITNLADFIRDDGLDGIELDCDSVLSGADMKQEVAIILTQLQSLITRKPITTKCPPTLGLRIPGWRLDLESSYDLVAVGSSVDTVSLEGFRYSSPHDATVKAHSPLYSGYDIGQLSVDQMWHTPGSPAHGSNTTDINNADVAQLSYIDLCKSLIAGDLKRGLSIGQVAHYAYGSKNQWIAYESPRTISFKADYAYKHKLGGVGISTLNDEDSFGVCNMGYFPLLGAAQSTCNTAA